MSKKGLKTMLVCIVLLIGLVTLFACNKSNVADKDGQTKVIVKIQDEDGSIYKENVVFSDLFTLSLQKEGYTGRLYRDADFLKPLTKDSKVKNGDTVYVKWTINKYTVTFMDGEKVLATFTNVTHGDTVTAPEVPKKDGKTFSKWDKDFSKVTSDLTINAVYDVDTFTVTFKDGEKVLETQTVEYEAAATAPDTARLSPPEGMHFAKWDKDFSKVTESIEVSAVYELNEYTVIFKNGETTLKTEMVKHGFAATAPNVYDTATKKFVGWDKSFDNVTSDLIVNAKFETKKFTLTFINFDGTTVYTAEVEYGASIDSHFETADNDATYDATILDYDGWYKADGTRIDELDLPTMPAENFTLTLKLSLMDSAIGDFTVNTPADFTYVENNSAVFTVNGTPYDGVTYEYFWTILKDNEVYSTETTIDEQSLTLQNLAAGEYLANVKIVASMENCGSVEKGFTADKTLIVSRADISGITVTGGTFTYGDENAKIKIDGLKDGDKVFYGKDGVSFSSEIVDFSKCDVGEYKYSVKVVRNENFNEFTSDVVTINVTKAAVTIRFSPNKKELVYGDDLPALTAYVGNKIIGTVDKGNYFLKLGEIAFSEKAVNVGEYAVEVKGFTNDYYNDKNFDVTFLSSDKITISRAKLVVKTLAAADIVYGNDLPEIGYEITGWKNGDEKTEYTLVPTTEYNKKSSVGPYSFSYGISGERIKYYDTETNVVSFNVTKRAAEIIINDVKDIVYGDEEPKLSAKVKNVLDGDTLSYTLKTDYSAKKKPGGYNAFVEIKEGDNSNYNVSVVNKTFTVLKKELTITLGSKRVAAGKEYKVDAASLTIDGLLADDTVTGYVTITKTEAGVYTANDFDKTNLKFDSECYKVIKYDLTVEFVKVDFKIHFADKEVDYNGQNHNVSVTADDGTNYTITYGTKKGIYDLTDAPSYKNAGEYVTYFKVVDNSLDDGSEYEDEIKLTVKKAEVEIKIGTYTMTYGNELPEFSYEATGLLNGDTLSGEAQYIVEGMTDGNVGTYKVKVGGLSAGDNYTIIVEPGTLTINPKSVEVVWSAKDKYVYSPDGQEMPAATYDGNTAKVTTNGEFKNAGTYAFTATDESGNYTLTNAVLNVVIEKATYSGIVHAALSGVYNPAKTLKDYALQSGDFRWANESEKPVCTKTEYAAIYNADSTNYFDFALNIAIDLQKAKVALKDGVVGFDYDGTSHEIKAVVTYNGVALDTSLYSLTYDGKDAKTFTDAGTHRTLVTMQADNYDLPKNTYVYVKVKGVKVGNNYYTIEDALFYSESGDTIEFINGVKEVSFAPRDVAEAIYADKAYRKVKEGVTLILASDEDSSATIGTPTYGAGSARYVDTDSSKIKYKLILNESTVLEVYGNILIQGLLGFSGQQGYQGHTSGNHSQIINNGTINLNNGAKLDLRGYIKGTGKIEARSGATVYSPFVVRDFRGGSSSAGTYYSGVSPFNVYEMPNIQCLYGVNYGATHTAYMDLFGGGKHNNVTNNAIASNSAVIILKEGSRLIKTYDRDSEKSTLTIYGNVELGDLSMEVSGATIKMSDVRFPIPWNYTINIGDGIVATSFAVKYDYKIMTGATVNVKKNATVNLTGTVVIYKEFTDQAYAGWVYPNKEPAKFCVEGKVSVNGKLVSKAGIAGEITGLNGGKVIIGKYVNLQLSSKEGHATNILPTSFVKVATISATAELVNADGNKITAETDRTYNYNNGTWTWQ